MRFPKWFVSILVIASIAIAGGWLAAGEDIAPGNGPAPPETTAAQLAVPAQDRLPIQVAAPVQEAAPDRAAAASREESAPTASTPEQEETSPAHAPRALSQVPPYGLQALVDERRDLLRKRRSARLDSYGSPSRYMPPWFAAYDNSVERYRDARRSMHRRQKNLNRRRHGSWMDAICPWSKPQRARSAQRSYLRQMEQLDLQEHRNAFMNRPPPGFTGPAGW